MADIPQSTLSLARPEFLASREVRFAVVMYGGVSLAIYINGIAQELYQWVRATAPEKPTGEGPRLAKFADSELSGSARAYRKLSHLVADPTRRLADIKDNEPIRTRFVVDILSGTSAGGINAIFLAKALANDQQIEQLKQLWINEADIALLINDKGSVKGLELPPQDPPESLLNSQRMYRKLLDALDGMDSPNRSRDECRSPYVDQLDLYVTATDISGLVLPIRLSDRVVYEKRHRHVFHFVYATEFASGDDRNDFHANNNPFLAFAARSTSAFPFAFEPMRLCDMDEILQTVPHYRDDPSSKSTDPRWRVFFRDYLRPSPNGKLSDSDFPRRAFGDGGYLDNAPFSHAIATLLRRRADLPVDRRLIYIEPAPAHPERESVSLDKPDAIENVMAALLVLPRHETIREDIQRIMEHNQLIERVSRVIRGFERDVELYYQQGRPQPLLREDWARQDLTAMIQSKGVFYGIYHRLKVGAVTDELAALITRVAGFNEDSQEFLAIRYLVRAWRNKHYVIYRSDGQRPTQNQFLVDFDLSYRLRRLNFLQNQITKIYHLDERAGDEHGGDRDARWYARETMRLSGVEYIPKTAEETQKFRADLLEIKREINDIFVYLRRVGRKLRSRGDDNPLRGVVAAVDISL
ncbi:MAG: patatin-like protein, partial [Abditibacteriales bacterium]|nr:patatin-like protein [Abditibacteriales bacterium]